VPRVVLALSREAAGGDAINLEVIAPPSPYDLRRDRIALAGKQSVDDPVGRRPSDLLLLEVDRIQRPCLGEIAGLGPSLERLAISGRVAQMVEQLPCDLAVGFG
jgi:hypothetical protein